MGDTQVEDVNIYQIYSVITHPTTKGGFSRMGLLSCLSISVIFHHSHMYGARRGLFEGHRFYDLLLLCESMQECPSGSLPW